jgi:phenylacetic acid degradation operon negative regulatory protein
MASKATPLSDWIKRTLKAEPPRSKSLIVTIFGDSISPYADGIWLSELIDLLQPFQVNERLVRTSCFRLAEEGWIEPQREGRRSRYVMTSSGTQRVQHAHRRIYNPPPIDWSGDWTFVLLSKTGNIVADRAELRRELEWEGFGALAPGIFVHPHADTTMVSEALERLNLTDRAIVLRARDLDDVAARPVSSLAAECWNLDEIALHYSAFIKHFSPLQALLSESSDITPQTAFVAQTLLIHSFRRVTLHDPRLPASMLPEDWPGHVAYELCRTIYLQTFLPARQHLAKHLEPPHGELIPNRDFRRRLGGIEP